MVLSALGLAVVLRREVTAGNLSRLGWFAILAGYAAAVDLVASLFVCGRDTLRVRGESRRPETPPPPDPRGPRSDA